MSGNSSDQGAAEASTTRGHTRRTLSPERVQLASIGFAALALTALTPAGYASAAPYIDPAVPRALEMHTEVSVIVFFRALEAERLEDAADARHARKRARRAGVARAFVSGEARRALRLRREALLRSIPVKDFRVRHRFRSLNAFAGSLTLEGLNRLRAHRNVVRVDLDVPGGGALVEARSIAKLDDVHTDGYTGQGITVAVLDSGVDLAHVDLAADVVAEQCFCSGSGGCCPNSSSTQSGSGAAQDDHGHGSNVTGIVTSDGTIAPLGGAPDAEIVAVKVLDQNNVFSTTSDVIMGLEWVVDNQPTVDIVNMSLATSIRYSGDCDAASSSGMAFSALVATLRDRGVVTIAASGNNASGSQMPMPACIADVISVGAVYDDDHGSESFSACSDPSSQVDQVTCFSNSNSETDLFAPGARTTSTGEGSATSTMSGTSMATPLVAACAATLLEAHPEASAGQLETSLKSSPVFVTDATNSLEFPRLDCAQAHATLTALLVVPPIVPSLEPRGFLLVILLLIFCGAGAFHFRRAS